MKIDWDYIQKYWDWLGRSTQEAALLVIPVKQYVYRGGDGYKRRIYSWVRSFARRGRNEPALEKHAYRK